MKISPNHQRVLGSRAPGGADAKKTRLATRKGVSFLPYLPTREATATRNTLVQKTFFVM